MHPIGANVLIVNGLLPDDRKFIGQATVVVDHVLACPNPLGNFVEAHIVDLTELTEDRATVLYRTQDLMPLDPDEEIKKEKLDELEPERPILETINV